MHPRKVLSLILFAFVFLPAYQSAAAQGVIVPRHCDIAPRCPRPIPRPVPLPVALPVKSVKIDTKIEGQVAVTTVEQVFRNDSPYVLEGTYFFPIPEEASVQRFAIWEDGKKLAGEVRPREEARRIYNEIVRKMKDPGLLEYAGEDLFQASIFPIPANSDKKLELTYSQILKAESATVGYRYPLGTGRNLWTGRGVTERTEGVTRRPDPQQKFGTVSGRIEISGNRALRNIYSPSHAVDVSRKGEQSAVVTFETKGDPSDFQLFYGLSDQDFAMTLLTYREPGKDGYFLLMLSPDDKAAKDEIVSKDVIFVIDTSGSMAETGKIEKARPALEFGIRKLNPGDRFNIINFSGEEHLMETGLIAADEAGKRTGAEFVKRLSPDGGTNINDALRTALGQFDSTDRPKMLVFLTDGRPTVGVTDIDRIISNFGETKIKGLRLFPFGVGYDVNTRLLDKLAAENAGTADYVQPKEDLEVKVSNFFNKVNSPVLSDIDIDFGALRPELMYPRRISDLFRGTQLVIIGRYRNSSDLANISFRLTGKRGTATKEFRYDNLAFPLRETGNEFLPRLWASRRVGWLIEEIRTNGENKELRDEIVELGTRYGIVTPYTSYLATDGTYQPRATTGNTYLIGDGDSTAISLGLSKESGRSAVTQSVQQNTLTENYVMIAPSDAEKDKKGGGAQVFLENSQANQFVGTKNFIYDAGRWVDTEFDPEDSLPETGIRFASNEYFELVNKEKALARYLALGKQVVIVWNGRVYRITE